MILRKQTIGPAASKGSRAFHCDPGNDQRKGNISVFQRKEIFLRRTAPAFAVILTVCFSVSCGSGIAAVY